MGKLWVEVCMISARGLKRSSLWNLQWFAVGWIEPNNKYCTRIDSSGSSNPVWKTKFAALVDDSNLKDMALNIEVYSREPVFLRKRLEGTVTIVLKEFLAKHRSSHVGGDGAFEGSRSMLEEVGSYQLRKKSSSSKPMQGIVDVSIRVSLEKEEPSSSYTGNEGGFVLLDYNYSTNHTNNAVPGEANSASWSGQSHPKELPQAQFHRPQIPHQSSSQQYAADHSTPPASNIPTYPPPLGSGGGFGYSTGQGSGFRPPPPPPPPPSNIGYVPTFLPNADYINMPPSVGPRGGRGGGAAGGGLAMGVGAGALAAGAVIFGDDFMSGFDVVPNGLHDPTVVISTDPPY